MKKLVLLVMFINLVFAVNVGVVAKNVDDIIQIYVDGQEVATCQWQGANCNTGKELNLKGKHTIEFKLTNLVYTGFCLFGGCGKYSGDFGVTANGKALWSGSVYVRDNTKGVKYDKVLECKFSDTKSYCIEK